MTTVPITSSAARLRTEADALLRRNDTGSWTVAAPDLYPHQWSWDTGFIAIGWAHIDLERAIRELQTLLAAQWSNGKLPHIVFNPDAPPDSYWPGPRHWACRVPDDAPVGCTPGTSGLCQPPVHAIAAARLWRIAARTDADTDRIRVFLSDAFPRLMAWHAYLLGARDPDGSGLVSIYHPWESGMDNAPRWDQPLAAITVTAGDGVDQRPDLQALGDRTQRPRDLAYDRFHLLVERLRDVCYDDAAVRNAHPFVVKDVFASGLLVAANLALADIAEVVGASLADRSRIRSWVERGLRGVQRTRDPATGLARDLDERTGRWLQTRTIAGFAELVAARPQQHHLDQLIGRLRSTAFAGHPLMRWAVPPSTSPFDPAFDRRRYWRGPSWPVMTWLLWWALQRAGRPSDAARLRVASLDQVWCSGGFPEYVEPFSGEPLGSLSQSWTAAVTIDWLADGAPWSATRTVDGQHLPCDREAEPRGFVQ